jgi:hypothetical protein
MTTREYTIEEKKKLLAQAVTQLKTEFIGIDGIIDEVADAILPWWLFPQHQMRPLIINLWGMTGSGKTALIKRLADMIHYNNMLMRFDMGEFGNSSGFLKWTLTRQLASFNESAPIILLDEFQFAKTKDETGKEVNNYNLRIIWDLLDSGELTYEPDGLTYYAQRAKRIINMLTGVSKQKIKMKDGLILNNEEEVSKIFKEYIFGYQDSTIDRIANPNPFKPSEVFLTDEFCTGIYEMNQAKNGSWQDVADKIKQMQSIDELLEFIIDMYESEMAFKTMDLRHSLIFVVGNLDEAFVMSNNINPDIDADEFKRYTEKITIADIKHALQSRFRNEQIARLGNTHLIYHAFSHRNFEQLIELHLDRLSQTLKEKFNLKSEFTQGVKDIIYVEGVFPTQGVRPVISTIRNMIESNFAKVILHLNENAKSADRIHWDFNDDYYTIDFYSKKNKISTLHIKALQKVNSLRKSTHNDMQALVAVHEAGHAVVSIYEVNVLPDYIITKTVDTSSNGFTYIILPEDIITYKLLIDQIKIGLGGYVAEAMIYGPDLNTTGVSHDLQRITNITHQIIREYGMHGLPAKHNIHIYGGNSFQFTFTEELEDRARKIIEHCLVQVQICLEKHRDTLMELSLFLSDTSRIDKPEILDIVRQVSQRNNEPLPTFVDKDSYYDFRRKLFDQKK